MALHFSIDEYAARQAKVCAELERRKLDGILLFRQESLYYLTGYDTQGFVMFQGLYLRADGEMALLTRSADRLQARITSVIENIQVWEDRAGADPTDDLRQLVSKLGGAGARIGVEYEAYGLTAARGKALDARFEGFASLLEASDLVRQLRLTKSSAELDYVRKSGKLGDQARDVALRMCRGGANLGEIYGQMLVPIMTGGGDPPASNWPLGCGEEALMVRYHTGLGVVGANDQVTFEYSSAYRHYHTPSMHVVLTGEPDARQLVMFDACSLALEACEQTLKPGNTVGDLFETHARVLREAGFGHAHLNACGYTMNANYSPNWMDEPMFYAGQTQVLDIGMVFFMHMILLDGDTGLSMSLGETSIVTATGCEPVTHAPRRLTIN
jgi:Xaa-Pro dipeptidase